jgi:flagellar export protein FliJ
MELDARHRDVAETTREVIALQERIASLNDTTRANATQIRASQAARLPLDLPQIRLHYVHQGYLARQTLDAQLRLGDRQSELQRRRARLNEANAKVKAIDKLYERQKKRFEEALRKSEQRATDEQALRVHAAKVAKLR